MHKKRKARTPRPLTPSKKPDVIDYLEFAKRRIRAHVNK